MDTQDKGIFVVVEGGDGAGKSEQIKRLEAAYGERLVLTREPGGTPYAEDIRTLALKHPLAKEADGKTQFMLMWASRAEHMNHLIIPSLQAGKIVVSDRFDSSSFAYNIFAQDEGGLVEYFDHTRKAILGLHTPDLYIYLDVSPEVAKTRMGNRADQNHFDERPPEFHQKVRAGFLEFFKGVPHVVIDADQTIDEVFVEVQAAIERVCAL